MEAEMLGILQSSRGAGVLPVAKTGISILPSTCDSVFCSGLQQSLSICQYWLSQENSLFEIHK